MNNNKDKKSNIQSIFVTIILMMLMLKLCEGDARINPLKDPLICGRPQCDSDEVQQKFNYDPKLQYKYDYRMHLRTQFAGSGNNSSDVYVSASVFLIYPKKCEGILIIKNVKLREVAVPEKNDDEYNDYDYQDSTSDEFDLHPKSVQFADDVEEHNLRFSFHDGVIGEICPTEAETNWVLNFKKGILSALQNTMARFDIDHNSLETDVSGTCNVAYSLLGAEGTSLKINKTKDISSCTNRYKTHSILQTTPYDFRQKFAVWPILKSNSYCDIMVDHSVYKEVKCVERHQLVPFSNNDNGAVTESTIHLKLSDEEKYETLAFDDTVEIEKRSLLLFDHYPTPKPINREIKLSRELLIKLCDMGFPDIQRDFIDVFTKFLQTVKFLPYDRLQELLARSQGICRSENGKNHVLESLPYIGSTASVQLMIEQMVKKNVAFEMTEKWLTSLSFLERPDEETLEEFIKLLEYGKEHGDPRFILTSTTVAHSFCRNHPECQQYAAIGKIVLYLENELTDELNKTHLNDRVIRERIVALLKGLGNIGVINDDFLLDLQNLALNETVPTEIRLEAILAQRRTNCLPSRDYFLKLYANLDANTELRIAAYLQAMRCPDYRSIKKIKYTLTVEEVNQVGSYVWSHLTNLAKSASPVRVATQGLLVDEFLSNKYKLDIRKFSRNFEYSLFFDEYNVGATSEANLIFGTESYLPRSASYNFSLELFGESVNIFELSARMQGFEHLLESQFGPKGPLNSKSFKKKYGFLTNLEFLTKYFKNKVNLEEYDYLDAFTSRFKREHKTVNDASSNDGMDENYVFEKENDDDEHNLVKRSAEESTETQLANSVDNLNYKLRYNYNEPQASFGLKIFGNDIQYKTIEGLDDISRTIMKLNPKDQLIKLLSGREINYVKSGVLLDVSYNVPLSSGFPLSIHAFGASSIDFRMSGSLKEADIPAKKFNIEGKLKPSVSLDIITSMESDYFYGSSGIRVKSNLFSSSSVDASAKIDGYKLGSLQFSLPRDRNDIFSVRTELLVINANAEIPQKGIQKRYTNNTCSWKYLNDAIGLKLCADYSLPDLSNSTRKYPSLILSGPININLHLDKSDLTAKKFLFEYRWNDRGNQSEGSISFNTPDSVIPRIFSANLTKDPENYQASMSFRNGDIIHSAEGSFRNASRVKHLKFNIILHGKRNVELEFHVNSSSIRNGWSYYPTFYLTIFNVQYAGLDGQVNVTNKKGEIQYDYKVYFETKKLQTQLSGHISQNNASIRSNLEMDYLFKGAKKETIEVKCELANRGQHPILQYNGEFTYKSTAYPQYNFSSNVTYLKKEAHIELKIDVNNNMEIENYINPHYTTSLRLMFAKNSAEDAMENGYRTTGVVELTRPSKNWVYRFKIKHIEKIKSGTEHNALVAVRYGPKHEATGVFSIHFPRGSQSFDSMINITIPSIPSNVVLLKVFEYKPNEFQIDFNGSIFSGQSVVAKGFYKDKSTSVKSYHHLKVEANSDYFYVTNVDIVYWRDKSETKVDIQTSYGDQPYNLLYKYSERVENEQTVSIELKIQDKQYSIKGNLTSLEPKQLTIEINIDRVRDVHLILRGLSTNLKQEAGIEIIWDANRDPTQKLAFAVELNTPKSKIYDGNFQISYPERTISGTFDLDIIGPEYRGSTRLGWSPFESIAIKFNAGSRIYKEKDFWAIVEFNTPFEGWRSNGLNCGLYYGNNVFVTNGSIVWADSENLGLSILAKYQHDQPTDFNCEFNLSLNSSIKDVPTANLFFKHEYDSRHVNTDLGVNYKPLEEAPTILTVKSNWMLVQNEHYRNISGSVLLRSPFEGYKTGAFSTKFSLTDKKQLRGVAELDLEEKSFTLSLEGFVKKFTENMLVANVTTPIEKFRNVVGRFGINEKDKHIVAEVRAPYGALGVELLFSVITVSNFNVKFNLETPLEDFKKIMVIGKMKPDTIEFMGGWNKIVLGYVGVWRHIDISDFEYSYKVYTPLANLTENGVVAKCKYNRRTDFDLELSFKLADIKLGIKMDAKPKTKLIRELGMQRTRLEKDDLFEQEVIDYTDDEDEEDDDEEKLNLTGNLELDTYVWPTFVGFLDVDEIVDTVLAYGRLNLPVGLIELRNRFHFPDYMNIKNRLKISLDLDLAVREITSIYQHSIDVGLYYIVQMEFAVDKRGQLLELGYHLNYTKQTEDFPKTHNIAVTLKTPSTELPRVYFNGDLQIDDHSVYKGNLSIKTHDTHVKMSGTLEFDYKATNSTLYIYLTAPAVPLYELKVYLNKDLTDVDNIFIVGYELQEEEDYFMVHVETLWNMDQSNHMKGAFKIKNNLYPLSQIDADILVALLDEHTRNVDLNFNYDISFPIKPDNLLIKKHTFIGNFNQKDNAIRLDLITPIVDFQNITFVGNTRVASGSKKMFVEGILNRDSNTYDVDGYFTLNGKWPASVNLNMINKNKSQPDNSLIFNFDNSPNRKTSNLVLSEDRKFVRLEVDYNEFSKNNWNTALKLASSDGSANKQSTISVSSAQTVGGVLEINLNVNTPNEYSDYGINAISLHTEVDLKESTGEIRNKYQWSAYDGRSLFRWSYVPLEDIQFMLENSIEPNKFGKSRYILTGLRFMNPKRSGQRLTCGANLNVNNKWNLDANTTLSLISKEDIRFGLGVRLPQGDLHKITLNYLGKGNPLTSGSDIDIYCDGKYEAEDAKRKYALRGQYRNVSDLQGFVRAEWGVNEKNDVFETNLHMIPKGPVRKEFSARVFTPFYSEDSLMANGSYDISDSKYLITARINVPASVPIADTDITFLNLSNMKGFVNTTTPFTNLTWIRGNFDFSSSWAQTKRYLKAIWPKNTAFFDAETTYNSKNLDRDLQGTIKMEFPLATRHVANIDYSLKERYLIKTGHCTVNYNKHEVLNGKYNCKSESSAGFSKDVVDISVENEMKPIGIKYVHESRFTAIDSPHVDMKRAEIYELGNSDKVNITGEIHIRTTLTGQDYKIVAIHPNRTVILTSEYDIYENIAKQNSKIQLEPNVWLAYQVMVNNFTNHDNDSQKFNLELSYPKRNLSAEGWYSVTEDTFESDLSFKWISMAVKTDSVEDDYNYESHEDDENEPKIMRAAFNWRNEPIQGNDKLNQTAVLTIRHPSFMKDVSFTGQYYQSPIDIMKTKLIIDYCDEADALVTFEANVKDLTSILGYRNYSLEIIGLHEATNLDLYVQSSIASRPGLYETNSYGRYERSYLSEQEGFLVGLINLREKEINYLKQTPHKTFRLWSKAAGRYPHYTINGSLEDSPDLNSTGEFSLNIDRRLVRLDINITEDASQNLRMFGSIPNARSASFDLWRDYEDIRVVDIAYYLRMNHSRLITSRLLWRPKLRSDIKAKVKEISTAYYDSVTENIDYWVKTVYSETVETINDIWLNAKPHTQGFLKDFGNLQVFESDIEEFRIFLNQSYESNDFYIKTMVNFTMVVLDELSIRRHFDAVPKIIQEIWVILGDSGLALQRSIKWLFETIKTSYKKVMDIIGRILHGEALDHLSVLMEKGVAKYDRFVKDLHLKFIKYVENIWTKTSDKLMNYWRNMMQRIEPTIITVVHYMEKLLWDVSTEIFNFLNKRRNEFVGAHQEPQLNLVLNFTHDLDRLYRDLIANDAITNIKKYTILAGQFIKERIYKVIPYGNELNNITAEFIEETRKLQNSEPIRFVMDQISEVQSNIEWIAAELQLEKRIHQLWTVISNKIARFTQTALQADDKYREAKTKFIFDPDTGLMELEQKLPMSWHAFNETPIFNEIPEYRVLADVQDFFSSSVSNFSLTNLYNTIYSIPYTEVDTILPPFKSHSLLIGSRHYITFDRKFVFIDQPYNLIDSNQNPTGERCSYLMAHDFVDSNFTLLLEPSSIAHHNDLVTTTKFTLFTEQQIIDIDISGSAIRIGRNLTTSLPIQIGDVSLYRDADELLIESAKGFRIKCNLLFDVCWFELSGWYFGKTAGILGNMNNEQYDEYKPASQLTSETAEDYKNSWTLQQCKAKENLSKPEISVEVYTICDELFKSKLSYFANCFAIVDPLPFYDMCLDLATNSLSNVIRDKHPAQKGICTTALAYIESCSAENTPLRIPDTCIHCSLVNGSYVNEGQFMILNGTDVPQTTDVVFIVEAKACNKNLRETKNITDIVNRIHKELIGGNITNSRFAVISFGGVAPFNEPRSIVYNNQIFTNYSNIDHYFDHIRTGSNDESSRDTFAAISAASNLVFRPGASKTFILIPCTPCNITNMKHDYSTILQSMLEAGINLHILMDPLFETDRRHTLFGLDRKNVYTKKDSNKLQGDRNLRKNTPVPKRTLDLCAPLAMETNGSIFSLAILKSNEKSAKKMLSVLAKRVALTAVPNACQECECTGHNSGTAYMVCLPCDQSLANLDYGYFDEDVVWNEERELIN